MQNFAIEATELTPEINFNPSNNSFVFLGNSSPENAIGFYAPVMAWFEQYANSPEKETTVEFKLDYINSASSKVLLSILFVIKKIVVSGNKLVIKWYHSEIDDEMKEAGETYAEIIEFPFEYIAY
jgi:hypothetical protein